MGVEVRRATVTVGPWRVHYVAAGEQNRDAVVLVHGFAASHRWWAGALPALAERYRVYAVDLPGFGQTRPRRAFGFAQAVEMLAAWMEALGISSANLVGHSMGGQVCIRLAVRYPRLVDRLVLVNTSGLPLRRPLPLLMARALQVAALEPRGFSMGKMSGSLRAGPLVMISAARALLTDDVRAELSRISAPTLVVWGDQDHLVPLTSGVAIAAAIPHAHLTILRGAGHKAMIEQPREFNALVLGFLDHTTPRS